jgi:HlyD family secretion protein
MKSPAPSLLVAHVLMATVCTCGCQKQSTDRAAEQPVDENRIAVSTVNVEQTNLTRTTTQPATVHAYFTAEISAKTTGYLSKLNADIGQSVARGEVLAVIDVPELSRQRQAKLATIRRLEAEEKRAAAEVAVAQASYESYQAMVEISKADVNQAEAYVTAGHTEFQRVGDLVRQKAVADRLLDEATKKYEAAEAQQTAAGAAVEAAEAQLALSRAKQGAAEADLEVARATTDVARRELDELDELIKYTQLTAPFDGVVTERHVDPGDLVGSTHSGSNDAVSPLFVMAQLDRVRVRVAVPERDAPLAGVGDAADITLQALPGQILHATVSRIADVLDEQTRTMLVEIDLPNPDATLLPGMFGQATLVLEERPDRLTLPASAVRHDEKGRSYVYVIDADNQVQVVDVVAGLDDGKRIEIVSGLNGNERIVAATVGRLKAGQKVRVQD